MTTSTGTNLSTAPARGMRDFLPAEVALRDWAIGRLVGVYERFGFTRIETPAVENIANLKQSEGGENLSLIFEILKRGDKLEKALAAASPSNHSSTSGNSHDLAGSHNPVNSQQLISELSDLGLRFDLTVPLVRFFSHNQAQLPYPFKSIQIGSVWRAESPQAGRYRQFTQCDIDTFGVKSEMVEMELIQATAEALLDLDFDQFTVRINDRRILNALAAHCGFAPDQFNNLFIQMDKLDKIGLDGVKKELLAQGHGQSSVEKIISFLAHATNIDSDGAAAIGTTKETKIGAAGTASAGYTRETKAEQSLAALLPPDCPLPVVTALDNVIKAIKDVANNRYAIKFDPSLVRGMGYYTGQIFEIVCEGQAHSIAGGGRYDNMVGKYTGREVPACGLSIGFERLITILMEKGIKPTIHADKIALLFDQDRDPLPNVFHAANTLRRSGKHVSLLPKKKEMRKQIDGLAQEGFSGYAVYYPDKPEPEIKMLDSAQNK